MSAIAELLEAATGLPAFVGVDLAAAALGERLYGTGRAFRDFYYLYFGVGLGGRWCHDGMALRGARGNAGEIGHLPLVPDGDPCPCGNRGCLDAISPSMRSIAGCARPTRALISSGRLPLAPSIVDGWIDEAAPLLRTAIVTIENLFDPETILIGGLAPDALLSRLAAAAEPLAHSVAEHGRTNHAAPDTDPRRA